MKTLPVGLQLYTVRDFMEKSVPETLAAVKAAGYDYVETAGLFGYSAEDFKKELDKAGLTAMSAHVPFAELRADIENIVKDYKIIGCKYMTVPYLEEGLRPGDDNFDEILADIDRIGAVCEANGMVLIYHNHDFEFDKMPDGRYGLDYMYDSVPANHLQSELDVCWVHVGGEEPADYIRKYAGRCPVVHLKDYVGGKTEHMYELIGLDEGTLKEDEGAEFKFKPVGHGKLDFPAILKAAAESGAEYVVVEQDRHHEPDAMTVAKMSRDYLKTLGF